MHVAAVARGNEVAAARILARTLTEHHPGWKLTVLVLPGVRPQLRGDEEAFAMLSPADLAARGEALPAGAPSELRAALSRPLLAQRLLDDGAERVLVIPPDAEVLGSLDAFESALREHSAVLVPRLLGSLPADGERPDARDLLEAGEIDDELVAVRGDEMGRALVEWWAERAREAAGDAAVLADAPEGASGARLVASPLGAAVRALPGVHVLEDPSIDVSYWNLQERPLAGALLLRWQGFRADRPWWLSDRASRTLVLDDPLLSERAGERATALREAGWIPEAEGSGSGRELPNGLVWEKRLRRLHAQALDAGEDFGDLYSPGGAQAFAAWLTEPAPQGATAGLNRYGFDVWRERRDVRDVFRDLDGPDGEGFVVWLWQHGRTELGLEEALLPPLPAELEGQGEHVPPVLLTGYLRGNLGLGAAARGYASALRTAGVPVATATIDPDQPVERRDGAAPTAPAGRDVEEAQLPDGFEPEVNLLCINAYQVPAFAEQAGNDLLGSRYTIGQWAWETDAVPPYWDSAFDLVDELWVYSRYVSENLARATDVGVPVVVVPLPVEAPDPAGATVPFEIPERYVFLFAFDFFSTLERKNPLGLIEAFKRAFAPDEGPVLLLKTTNARFRPEARERLRHAIGGRADILLVDATVDAREMAALFARADCYVSLHRAEGFGLTPAESMALGKPVIATGFSGNTDFMTPTNSYLVDWELTAVGPDAEHYPEEGTWAEPSVEHAAALMREVWSDPEAARGRGDRAKADIAAALSPEAVGAIARARLVRIGQRRPVVAAPAPGPAPGGELAHRLAFDLSGVSDGSRGPRRMARRALFRALSPYTTSERKLDEALATTVRRLYLELSSDRAARGRDFARAARTEARITALEESLTELLRLQEERGAGD
jgi:glycosyltransferase involved in cell wall biosynthesis